MVDMPILEGEDLMEAIIEGCEPEFLATLWWEDDDEDEEFIDHHAI